MTKNQGFDVRAETRRVAERILSLQRPDESDAQFARRIGVTPQAVYAYKRKDGGASLEAALTAAYNTGADLSWLVTGVRAGQKEGAPDPYRAGMLALASRVAEAMHETLEGHTPAGPASNGADAAFREMASLLREIHVKSQVTQPERHESN